jgi:hypothetical protein
MLTTLLGFEEEGLVLKADNFNSSNETQMINFYTRYFVPINNDINKLKHSDLESKLYSKDVKYIVKHRG